MSRKAHAGQRRIRAARNSRYIWMNSVTFIVFIRFVSTVHSHPCPILAVKLISKYHKRSRCVQRFRIPNDTDGIKLDV